MQEEAPQKKESTPEEKEEKKLKRIAATDDGLKKLLAERAALEKKIARVKAYKSEKERKEDTQVKIWIGGFFIKHFREHPEKFSLFERDFLSYLAEEKKVSVFNRWKEAHMKETDTPSSEGGRS